MKDAAQEHLALALSTVADQSKTIADQEKAHSRTQDELLATKQKLSVTSRDLSLTTQELSATKQGALKMKQELATTRQDLATTNQQLSAKKLEIAAMEREASHADRMFLATAEDLYNANKELRHSKKETSNLATLKTVLTRLQTSNRQLLSSFVVNVSLWNRSWKTPVTSGHYKFFSEPFECGGASFSSSPRSGPTRLRRYHWGLSLSRRKQPPARSACTLPV
jgi:hypothetical protein